MIIPDLKRTVIINAGHCDDPDTPHIEDPGASHNNVREAVEVMKVRDALVPILERHGLRVENVPDQLDLTESIAWANEKAPRLADALAVDIHLNWMTTDQARGSEAFFGTSQTSRKVAAAITKAVSDEMGIPDRGAKPDTQTFVGSLGWIRKTKMWASLIEVCFLTNPEDMKVLHGPNGYHLAATGIAKGILEVYGIQYQADALPDPIGEMFVCDADGNRIYKLTQI